MIGLKHEVDKGFRARAYLYCNSVLGE